MDDAEVVPVADVPPVHSRNKRSHNSPSYSRVRLTLVESDVSDDRAEDPRSSDLISNQLPVLTESQANQAGVEKHGVLLQMVLVGLLGGLAAPPVVLRMCPALTTKNFSMYQPLLAVGASPGIVQIYNLSSGQLYREFSMHSCTVRGIEWVSLRSFPHTRILHPSTPVAR